MNRHHTAEEVRAMSPAERAELARSRIVTDVDAIPEGLRAEIERNAPAADAALAAYLARQD